MLRSWWEAHVLPRVVDRALGVQEVSALRAQVCEGLEGRVLELGFGSGLNVPHYPAALTELAAVEPSDLAWRLASRRVAGEARVVRSGLDGQCLEEPDESFDAVLSTFTLCTIPSLPTALAEASRVLRPGGRFHFLEHGLAPTPAVQRWQSRLEPVQRRVAGGCHLTRHPVEALRAAGFDVVAVESGYLPGPLVNRPLAHLFWGRAVKR